MTLDLAHRHAARIERHDPVVEALDPTLALRQDHRLERAVAVARNRDLHLAIFGQHRLLGIAVAAVARATTSRVTFLVSEMLAQLRSERPFHKRLLQLLEQPFCAQQILGLLIASQQLIEQFRSNRHHGSPWLQVEPTTPSYTTNLTVSAGSGLIDSTAWLDNFPSTNIAPENIRKLTPTLDCASRAEAIEREGNAGIALGFGANVLRQLKQLGRDLAVLPRDLRHAPSNVRSAGDK